MFLPGVSFDTNSTVFSYIQVLVRHRNISDLVWSQTGNQGNKWRLGAVFLGLQNNFQVCLFKEFIVKDKKITNTTKNLSNLLIIFGLVSSHNIYRFLWI